MFCSKCGKEIDDKAAVCIGCGATVAKTPENTNDTGSFGWAVLGFFIPLAGLILWLLWNDTAPKNAKKAGGGALASVIAGVVFFILYIVFICFLFGYIIAY